MNIIIVSEGFRRSVNLSLSHRHVLVIALVGLLFLPALVGTVAYRIHDILNRHDNATDLAAIAVQKQALRQQRQQIAVLQQHTSSHLNALAQRLGSLQAQVLRLNALGQRLTRMARIDAREFNFSKAPAMGGPANRMAEGQPNILATLSGLATQVDRQTQRLTALESLLLDKQLQAAVTPSGWPTKGGWVSSGFGWRSDPFSGKRTYHEGVDIAAVMGSPVKAMGDGVVTYAGKRIGYGALVEINHGNGYATRYAHISEALVKVGDRVKKGHPVALVGSSGRSTGPHLHFEVLKSRHQLDPRKYLKQSRK
jgi:murein DD-endopeptidase MepM/ murein hydrolase activator NlpD